MKFFTLIN